MRSDDAELHPGLPDLLDLAGVGHLRRVVDGDLALVVDQDDLVLDRRRRGDQLLAELALQPLLDDLHVEQAQEAAAEAEAEGDRALGLEAEAGVVEVELLHGVAQERVVGADDRVDAGEDEALGRLVAGQRLGRGRGNGRDRVADLGLANALEAGRHVADLAGSQLRDRHQLRPEEAELHELGFRPRAHQPNDVVLAEGPLGEPDVADDALVRRRSGSRRSGP